MQTQSLDYEFVPAEAMAERARCLRTRMLQRRTVRDFASTPIPRAILNNALRIAASAPSGANRQPWRFVVVTNPDTKARIREAAEQEERAFYSSRAPDEWLAALEPLGTDANKEFLTEAPALIAIFLERYGIDKNGKRVKNYYTPESVGIASGFLIAALHLVGLATLTHTPSPMRFLNEILERPSNERPYLLLVVGYPTNEATVPNIDKLPIDAVVKYV
ncbi:MAG: nitroreductase family protein [Gammaproteobacteria bacterium]|nr:nitroreductase family protein [Gammaproteobacteria bacterium]